MACIRKFSVRDTSTLMLMLMVSGRMLGTHTWAGFGTMLLERLVEGNWLRRLSQLRNDNVQMLLDVPNRHLLHMCRPIKG